MTVIMVLGVMFALLLSGLPVAFSLGVLGLGMLVIGGFSPLMAPQAILSTLDGFILLAVPLFLLMSNILLRGGCGKDLFSAVQAWVGHWPGGLAVATIVSCGIFAAISGVSVATAATIGVVAIPEMIKRGYNKNFVYGLLAAGGTLGILIPPSLPMIVYGFVTEESVISLFLAGIGPGIFLISLFIIFSIIYSKFFGGYKRVPAASWEERKKYSIKVLPTLILAILILGGIYTGVFTPTEAAAVGFSLALFLTVILLRSLSFDDFKKALFESMVTTAAILVIIAGAKIFGKAIALYRIPQDISMFIEATIQSKAVFMITVCLILVAMGLVFETLSMVLIMVPVLLPAAMSMGVDPIWFGIFMVIMVECALITPPVGLNLYVIQSVAKTQLGEVAKGVIPFLAMMIFTVYIMYIWPDLALYIPFKL
ncbi:TRAP transporter large permease subunit [Alphaproteobacteria bacterium]|jgi:C4-dicarboxylate transporter DctM subunit|nr:TRAP transporter large permease subunit [Alphaproteobacteria bacterium]MDA9914682.1 TRAP transporter large permease subunit [Alphaproteobacteria bacterium]MDB2388167.1 TRAP transporter large permease subunit [Alphaproteobacteria bacterium]MDB2583408.1 TRAP transporter large permease subunit [Alphaproteobacteria bacterium]MDB2618170.1 TRAP transporter large permease subunit [Alphaproteobacteria bacterium]|tara:strand:+ start:2361 stop:3635 length:1275 start_codon:yes stop_codon:yes gene_type:complete